MRPGSSDARRRRGLWRLWVLRVLACLVGVVGLAAVAVLVLARSLDEPWLKRRLQGLVRTSAGVEIDYLTVRLDWLSGVEIEGLVVQSPAEVRPFAPDLVRVGRVDARWSLKALLPGRGPVLGRVALSDVTLTAVVDEHGRTSFDALSPAGSSSVPGTSVPLSRQASKFLGTAPPFGAISLDRVTVALIRTEHGKVSERTEVRGLAVALVTSLAEPDARGWRVKGGLGSPAIPLELGVTRVREGVPASAARAKLWLTVDATSLALTAALDLRGMEQTFAAGVSADHGLHAEVSVRFDPTAGRTEVTLHHTEAGEGAATAEASIEVPDTGDPIVHHAQGDIDLARLLGWLPAGLVPVTAERARVRYQVDSLVAGPVVRLSRGGAIAVDADLSNVALDAPGWALQVGGGKLSLRAQPVDDLVATQGDLSLSIELASLDVHAGGERVILDGPTLHAHTVLAGHAPYAVELEAAGSRLRVIGVGGKLLVDGPARFEGQVRDAQPDVTHPLASRGVVHAGLDLGEMRASLDATKGDDAIDFSLRATVRSLKAVRPFLPPALNAEASWDRMAVAVRSSGHVEGLRRGDPAVRQATELDIERPAFENVAARSVSLALTSQGTALHQEAHVDLHALGLVLDGGSPRDDHVTLSATADRERPSLQFELATEGRASTQVKGSLSFDRSRRALRYDIDGHLAGLAALAPFTAKVRGLDGFDLSQLEVALSAHGELLGVVSGVARDGAIAFEPSPTHSAAVEGKIDLRVAHFRWTRGDVAITTPSVAWHGDLRVVGARRILDSRGDVDALHLDLGRHDVDLNGIRDDATVAVIGDLTDPEIELTQRLSVRAVEQDVVPEYPVGDLAFALSADGGPEGLVHISDLELTNGLGGTVLAVTGNVDQGDGRRTLSVLATLTQDLAHLSTLPARFRGRGKVAVEASVISPDFAHYSVRALAKAEDVTLALPGVGVDVETANGQVPIAVALEMGENGLAFQRSEKGSPYSMLRFADQHPLLTRSGFLSIRRLKTPFVSIAPLVGNLEIEQNVISLRQFEMGIRGGTITGQCGIDWEGPKSTLELHVRASGVQSSHGEPFDGNIAVVIDAAARSVDGRAEILRIGKHHLLDLLDLEDPLHVDPAMNRVRTALRFGYPDSLRLIFDHGFARAHLELGGLARLVSIGELRGIPMGPIVDQMLAPMLDGLDAKGTP